MSLAEGETAKFTSLVIASFSRSIGGLKKQTILGAAALAASAVSFSYAPEASAIEPIRQGTFTVAAERLAGFGLYFPQNGDTQAGISLLASANPIEFQYTRVGFDYFVIDGLSIGGHLGMSYADYGATDILFWGIQPRIGYAFKLADTIDFWPRLGIGIYGGNNRTCLGNACGAQGYTAGLLTVEAMFLWNIVEHVGMLFGPTFDAGLASDRGVGLGANVGLLARF